MGKFKSWKYRNIFTSVASSTCLVGASAGLIFGVSAGTFKINYVDLNSAATRVAAANGAFNYYSQDIKSEWNMEYEQPTDIDIDSAWWNKIHNNAPMLSSEEIQKKMEIDKTQHPFGSGCSTEATKARYDYISMVIDGATHSTMDRSFNQGLYNGIVNFNQNKSVLASDLKPETENDPTKNCAKSYKPGGDNTTEFINIFNTVAKTYRVVGLAGFNHVTPLQALGEYNATDKRVVFTNKDIDKTAFLLIDGDVPNNQNVASVLFRSDQPGFLAAISTCMYFYNNLDVYHKDYQDLSVGLYGGTSIPTVTIYMGGAQRGIEFFNEAILSWSIIGREIKDVVVNKKAWDSYADAKKLYEASKYKSEIDALIAKAEVTTEEWNDIAGKLYKEYEIKQIKLGAPSTHFSGTFAAGDAIGITKQYLNRGASAIMAVAGPQSLDTAQEIQNQNSKCIVIGVDSAMEEGDYQRSFHNGVSDKAKAPDGSTPVQKDKIIKFSAVKDMTSVTQKFAELCANNSNYDKRVKTPEGKHIPDPDKAICGIGYKTCGNIQNGLISISWDGMCPFFQAMRHLGDIFLDEEGQWGRYSFDEIWIKALEEYIPDHPEIKSEKFLNNVREVKNLLTYDKGAWDGELYKNYAHVMGILGYCLNKANFKVPTYMNVDTVVDSEGKVVKYIEAKEAKFMTIIDWLKRNMYFSN